MVLLDGLDKSIHELLGIEEAHLRAGRTLQELMPYRLKKMRLAKANASPDKKRVPCLGLRFGHRAARGVREAVALAYYECLKAVSRGKIVGNNVGHDFKTSRLTG